MRKLDYSILNDSGVEQEREMNEPFCFMKAESALSEKNFSIWKLSGDHQNIHAHDYYQLWYLVRGKCRHRIDNHDFTLNRGDMIFIPPFSYHSMYEGSEDLVVIGVDFTESFFSGTEADRTIMQYCVTPIRLKQSEKLSVLLANDDIEDLILEMFQEYTEKKTFHNIIIKSDLTKLIVLIERMLNENQEMAYSKMDRMMTDVLKYIHSNFNEKISVKDLCNEIHMSETFLTNSFKAITGKTVVEYVNDLKINKAKQLLVETDMRVTDISYELGFSDGAYFNRVFKKKVKLTPNAYRKLRDNGR